MDVEEGHDVPFTNAFAVDVADPTVTVPQLGDGANGDVAGDDGKGDVEAAVVKVHVGAAHLGIHRVEQRCARLEIRRGDFADLERLVRAGHDASGVARSVARGARSVTAQ